MMSKAELLVALEDDFENPGSAKSGEFLRAHVVRTCQRAIADGARGDLVAILSEWLLLRQEPHTMLAVDVAETFALAELAPQIRELRNEVQTGSAFRPFYLHPIDRALHALDASQASGVALAGDDE